MTFSLRTFPVEPCLAARIVHEPVQTPAKAETRLRLRRITGDEFHRRAGTLQEDDRVELIGEDSRVNPIGERMQRASGR